MKVYLIGVGMGNPATLTGQALEAIGDSPVLVGAPRLLEPWTEGHDCVPLIAAADIAAYVDKAPRGPVGVLLSGDTGFYSGAKGLWPLLGNHEVITIPGISSLSYFCARLQTTWQDARLVSAHGRSHNAVGEIQRSAKVFALTGGATKAEDICRALAERGLGQVRVSVGERLSYADERIVTGTAAELAGETFADLSVLLAVNPDPVARPWNGSGLPDGAFLRGGVPMTKEEVRALALSKLRLEAHHVVWDVGAGTGSVSVECALSCPAGRVYAVEKKEEALALLAGAARPPSPAPFSRPWSTGGPGRWPSSAARTISTPCFTARSSGPKAATWTSSSWAGTPPGTCWRKTAGAAAWPSSRGSWATMTASA